MSIQRGFLVLGILALYACSGSNDSAPSTTTTASVGVGTQATKLMDAGLDPQQRAMLEPPLTGQLPRNLVPPI